MDSQPASALDAVAHNHGRNLGRRAPTMSDEVLAAYRNLAEVGPYLTQWIDGLATMDDEPSDGTTIELMRLVRLGAIVGELVNQARAATREASRISQQTFPDQG